MMEILSSWAKNLCLAVVLVSILEMLLPNNKSKKYIKMTMGLYILFTIISPFLGKDFTQEITEYLEESQTQEVSSEPVNQSSMDKRLQEICEEELEKDIRKKLEEEDYEIVTCKVAAKLGSKEEETAIEKITISLQKREKEESKKEENTETIMVKQIQKIKEVQIGKQEEKTEGKEKKTELSAEEKQEVKKFMKEEYGVKEACLVIK